MVAFANSDGGTIVIGLSDKHKRIEGVDYETEKLNEILRVPLDFCSPSVPVTTERIDCIDYKGRPNSLLVFHIEPSDKLHTTQADEAYIRVGDKSRRLSFEDRLQLMYDKGLMYFEESAVDGATLEDIDMNSVLEYCKQINYGKSVREYLMENKGYIVKKKDKLTPTVAAILLFGKNPQDFFPYAKIRFIKYDGIEEKPGTEMNVVKDITFTGTIKQQIDKAVELLHLMINEHTYLGPKGLFVTDPEYPEFVRQELIVNACCHRDYSIKGTDIHIKMFSNRLVVESPGNLPGRVRPDNIRHTHFSRNPKIAKFLKAYEFVREFGEGVDRMCRELEEADCGDVIFTPYAFMLRTTIMNRMGHAQLQSESLQTLTSDLSNQELFSKSSLPLSQKSDMNRGIKNSTSTPLASFSQKNLRLNIIKENLSYPEKRNPTTKSLQKVVSSFADNEVFGAQQIRSLIRCSEKTAGRIITELKEMNLIIPIQGCGKGRYTFKPISESEQKDV